MCRGVGKDTLAEALDFRLDEAVDVCKGEHCWHDFEVIRRLWEKKARPCCFEGAVNARSVRLS